MIYFSIIHHIIIYSSSINPYIPLISHHSFYLSILSYSLYHSISIDLISLILIQIHLLISLISIILSNLYYSIILPLLISIYIHSSTSFLSIISFINYISYIPHSYLIIHEVSLNSIYLYLSYSIQSISLLIYSYAFSYLISLQKIYSYFSIHSHFFHYQKILMNLSLMILSYYAYDLFYFLFLAFSIVNFIINIIIL